MGESAPDATGILRMEPPPDSSAQIASLYAAGAAHFDPVRLHYLQALAKRATAQPESVQRILNRKLAHALADFQERFEQAQCQARQTIAQALTLYPGAAKELQRLSAAGDFQSLGRLVATLAAGDQRPSLRDLVRRMEQPAAQAAPAAWERPAGSRPELKTIRNFRNTWSKLSVDKQVAQALIQAPKNAGPINSHMLVLRSLALMRDISPDYLNRFMSYADTLLCLDQHHQDQPATPKKPPVVKAAKKAKHRPGVSR